MSFRDNLGTHFLLLIAAIIWGTTWAAGRFLSFGIEGQSNASLDPATSAWLRYAFATLAFLILFFFRKNSQGFRIVPPDRESWKFSIWLGIFGTMC